MVETFPFDPVYSMNIKSRRETEGSEACLNPCALADRGFPAVPSGIEPTPSRAPRVMQALHRGAVPGSPSARRDRMSLIRRPHPGLGLFWKEEETEGMANRGRTGAKAQRTGPLGSRQVPVKASGAGARGGGSWRSGI